MQIVKVDGTVFLGELGDAGVSNIMQIDNRFMSEDLGKAQVATYVKRKHLNKLTNIGFGTTSAVQHRELTDDEDQLFAVAKFSLDVAVKNAVKSLEVSYFEANFAGK